MHSGQLTPSSTEQMIRVEFKGTGRSGEVWNGLEMKSGVDKGAVSAATSVGSLEELE